LINYVEVLLFCYLTGNADMHLKNFSLYKKIKETTLTPAYDLLSTKLVIPEDTEELALTLNGKKRKLKRSDFDNLLKTMKVEDKVIENTYNKFRKVVPLWYDFIDISFLLNQMKIDYKALIEHRSSILNK
jgi:toxin-antitoxin system, toxin component, hipA family